MMDGGNLAARELLCVRCHFQSVHRTTKIFQDHLTGHHAFFTDQLANNSDRHTKHYHCDHIGTSTFILNLLDSTTLLLYHQYDPLRILLPRRFCLRDFGKSRNQRWRCVLYCTSSSIFIVRSARFQVYTWWWRWWWWWEHVLYDCA